MSALADPQLSIVVPVYNEGSQVVDSLGEIRAHLTRTGSSYELIVIDDGSTDETWQALNAFVDAASADETATVEILRLSRNFGKEAALCLGLEECRGQAVIVMDADLQHPPELIPRLVELWSQGHDVVEAVKTHRGRESLVSRLGSWLFYHSLSAVAGVDLEGASDYKLLSRRALDKWLELGERETFFRGLVAWLGFPSAEVPFAVPDRRVGGSRWSAAKRFRLALLALTSFSSLPLQLITFAGLALFLLSMVLAVQALWQKWQGQAVEGFTTVIILNGMIGSSIMISLGIIGLYIARIYNEIKRRPRYVVSQRKKAGRP